jgi:hypothetical protein
MSPSNKTKYEEIYTANRGTHGEISFASLEPLYSSLDVPDTDIRSAWNLINPNASQTIGKDATLAFLHILNNRHEGFRIPRSVPASLRSTFERGTIEYNMDRVQPTSKSRWAAKDDEGGSRKAKFGDAYLTRLGVGERAGFNKAKGTDFSATKGRDDEWEEVRLKRQLKDIEEKIERAEKEADKRKGGRDTRSKPALVKRELEMLLDYKRRELRDLDSGEGKHKASGSLKELSDDIAVIKEQVDGLQSHLSERERVLDDLKRQIEEEKSR